MTRQPKIATKPPVEDPLHEKEVFVSDVAGVGLVHGNVVMTFTSLRAEEPAGGGQPKLHNIVVARLALTNYAAGQLLQQLQRLSINVHTIEDSVDKSRPN
jgi:hypothetical protein